MSIRRLLTQVFAVIFFLMIRRPPRSTLDRSSAASDVYKRQLVGYVQMLESFGTRSTFSAVDRTDFGLGAARLWICLLYTSPSPRDRTRSRMPSSA